MAWYIVGYCCPDCGSAWEDEWSCACDDSCPGCGCRDISPARVQDVGRLAEWRRDGSLVILLSRHIAGESPEYVEIPAAIIQRLAKTYDPAGQAGRR